MHCHDLLLTFVTLAASSVRSVHHRDQRKNKASLCVCVRVCACVCVLRAGITVMLDVSTPVLASVVVSGNLIWDDTQGNTEIQLNTNQILVRGGNLTIGSNSTPYPGRARITL